MNPTQRIYESCRNSREDYDGAAVIRSKDVATLIRARLKLAHPNTKFSVRSDSNSVRIDWTDGPLERDVQEIVDSYQFGGFDGMIDLAYSGKNWLLPNGTMLPASSPGTEGSGGSHEGYATDCPAPGAVLVKYGPDYVFCQRHWSENRLAELVTSVERRYGQTFDRSRIYSERVECLGEYVTTVCHRLEQGLLD